MHKRVIFIILMVIACFGGLYLFLTWNGNGNPDFMHHRYNKVVTEPLAKLGIANAQYKMGLFWFYGSGEDKPNLEELTNALYWFEKASDNGDTQANKEIQNLLKVLEDKNNAYYKAGIYYSMALDCLKEQSYIAAKDYVIKAVASLENESMKEDSLYMDCCNLIQRIELIVGHEDLKHRSSLTQSYPASEMVQGYFFRRDFGLRLFDY